MANLNKPCPVNAADVEFLIGKDFCDNVVDVPISSLPNFPLVDVEKAIQGSPTVVNMIAEDSKLLQLYLALKGRVDDFRILPIHLQKSIEELESLNLCNVKLTLCDVEGDTTFHGDVIVDNKLTSKEIEVDDLTVNGTAMINEEEVANSHIINLESDDAAIERLVVNESIEDKGTLNVVGLTTTHDIENDGDITNSNDFLNGRNIENTNKIINHGDIENDNDIINHNNITNDKNISNGGDIENEGDITNHGSIDNENNIINHGNIENENNFTNMGDIENDGDIINHSNIENNGDIVNHKNIINDLNITNHGDITNDNNIINKKDIINSGDITNDGKITNKNGIENTGDITNHGDIVNDGNIINENDITNNGKVTTKDFETENAKVTTKIQVTGDTETNGIVNHGLLETDSVKINEDLEVDGHTDIQSLEVNKQTILRGKTYIRDEFEVTGNYILNGNGKFNGNEEHNGDVVYNGEVTFKGKVNLKDLEIDADLDDYQKKEEKGKAKGYASLDNTGKVPKSQLPDIAGGIHYSGKWNPATGVYPSDPENGDMYQATRDGIVQGVEYHKGDRIIRSEDEQDWGVLADNYGVSSVNGRTGAVEDVQDTADRKDEIDLEAPSDEKYISEKGIADVVNDLLDRIAALETGQNVTSPNINDDLPTAMLENGSYDVLMDGLKATDIMLPIGGNVNVNIETHDGYYTVTPMSDITNPKIDVLYIKKR